MWNSRNGFHVNEWLVAPICCQLWSQSWSRRSNGGAIWFDGHQMSVKIPQEINTATFTSIPVPTPTPNVWFSKPSMRRCKTLVIRKPQRNLQSPYVWVTPDRSSNVGSKPEEAVTGFTTCLFSGLRRCCWERRKKWEIFRIKYILFWWPPSGAQSPVWIICSPWSEHRCFKTFFF